MPLTPLDNMKRMREHDLHNRGITDLVGKLRHATFLMPRRTARETISAGLSARGGVPSSLAHIQATGMAQQGATTRTGMEQKGATVRQKMILDSEEAYTQLLQGIMEKGQKKSLSPEVFGFQGSNQAPGPELRSSHQPTASPATPSTWAPPGRVTDMTDSDVTDSDFSTLDRGKDRLKQLRDWIRSWGSAEASKDREFPLMP